MIWFMLILFGFVFIIVWIMLFMLSVIMKFFLGVLCFMMYILLFWYNILSKFLVNEYRLVNVFMFFVFCINVIMGCELYMVFWVNNRFLDGR